MRKDLNKVMCERERDKGWKALRYHHVRQSKTASNHVCIPAYDEEESFTGQMSSNIEGSRRRYGFERKHFSENLSPLKGWLRKCVGKNWDDSYSELRQNFNADSTVNAHILTHLWQYVERYVVMKKGEPYTIPEFPSYAKHTVDGYTKLEGSPFFPQYYVHPEDGCLYAAPVYVYKRVSQARTQVELVVEADRKITLDLEKGIWYRSVWEIIPPESASGPGWNRTSKKQLNKVELKWYKLKNKS